MRPLRLTMKAFGPYRDAETIDFTRLEDRRLFVISGNTGAGKTTIFDAICFAIYGTASGEDRSDPRMLRSHFADEDTHTSVELDFAVGSKRYRVFRQMKHRKGGNRSETGEKTELYELTGDEAVPAVDRFMTTEVNAKLLSIIGLTKEQFSQIVMLPQGEFRKLLTSDTDNKEEILRRIFRTELYEKLEQRFQSRNRELQERLKEARAGLSAVMRQAEEALPLREDSALAETFRQEVYSVTQVLGALSQEVDYYKARTEQAAQQKRHLVSELDKTERRLREALELNGKFGELEVKKTKLAAYAEKEAEVRRQEKALELASKAAIIVPYEEQAMEAARSMEMKRELLVKREAELQAAEAGFEAARAKYQEEAAGEAVRRETEHELLRLTELSQAVASLAARSKAVERQIMLEKEAAGKHAAIERSLAERKERRARSQTELKASEQAVTRLPVKLDQLRQIEQKGKAIKKLIELTTELERFVRLEREGNAALEKAVKEHDRMERLWLEGQAGMLASHLVDGKPCPVCGSESHPNKAHGSEQIPSKETLQQSKEALTHVQNELMQVKAQAAAAAASQTAIFEELEDLGLPAGDLASPAEAVNALQVKQRLLREEWKLLKEESEQLQQTAKRYEELRSLLESEEKELESLEQERERLRSEEQRLIVERTAAQTALEKELERIPESLRTPEALAKKLESQRARFEQLERSWKAAQEMLQQADSKLAETKAFAQQAKEGLAEGEKQKALSEQRLQQQLEKSGFPSLADYRLAVISAEDMGKMSEAIHAYHAEVAGLKERVASLELELKGLAAIDTDLLLAEQHKLKERYEAAVANESLSRRCSEEAERLTVTIERSGAMMAKLEKELEGVSDLYAMLKGDNDLKMSFERYILIEYLEQILSMANARLKELSNGQFELQRSDRLEARGKQSGLGLDVYDAYTGQNRDVKSLSGGEKFNASLCLALGMTDVIQAHQGGVSIEMMLIDEGFGSLDEESLHKAVAALVDLQKAGRMIGVISHVGELKEAFPACLEVTKTKEGFSRTAIVLK
ncbi:SMC family ATPase [Paenibacillus nanensis]|uniref:Nuclease SbcCD subunit C n=1 Tax=Paenibacillus nanensis TaxID=393251 RepID=A0A3A1UZ13_9BACL|nr:AAA family ATPase [Paenibacillus nanensis]RIX52412.1 SMC family ATPase [Paenibacillus nanensis]